MFFSRSIDLSIIQVVLLLTTSSTSTLLYLLFPSYLSHITNPTYLVQEQEHHHWRAPYPRRREREKFCQSEGRVINVLSEKSVLLYCIFLLSSSSRFLFLSVVYWLLRITRIIIIGLVRRHEDASGN